MVLFMGMSTFTAIALVNVGPHNFMGYTPDAPLAPVTESETTCEPIAFTLDVPSEDHALSAMNQIGNRAGFDRDGRMWPSDVRSLSNGDVVVLLPGVARSQHTVEHFLMDGRSYFIDAPDFLEAEITNSIVSANNTNATSRQR